MYHSTALLECDIALSMKKEINEGTKKCRIRHICGQLIYDEVSQCEIMAVHGTELFESGKTQV